MAERRFGVSFLRARLSIRLAARDSADRQRELDKRALIYMLDSILAKHAIILFSPHTFNHLSISKNLICNRWLGR